MWKIIKEVVRAQIKIFLHKFNKFILVPYPLSQNQYDKQLENLKNKLKKQRA